MEAPAHHTASNAFVRKLRQQVENNLHNPQFSVEQLAEHMHMSRSQLHRKLKKYTGQSVNQFIREYRLQKALDLLRNGDKTVSEVAFEVGFSSHSYFTSCFTEHYGYPPGEVKHKSYESVDSKPIQPTSRQLAAIMFTDIVGYTGLMEEDEQRAFNLLKKNRRIQRPIIEKHKGKWLKEIGDGVLASFATITDAVHAAGEIQKTCEGEDDLKLRIGIHQGEVIFDEEDVFGSGGEYCLQVGTTSAGGRDISVGVSA